MASSDPCHSKLSRCRGGFLATILVGNSGTIQVDAARHPAAATIKQVPCKRRRDEHVATPGFSGLPQSTAHKVEHLDGDRQVAVWPVMRYIEWVDTGLVWVYTS